MAYCTNLAHVNVTAVRTNDDPEQVLGACAEMSDGSAYRYVYYTAVKTAGLVYLIDAETWEVGEGLTTTNGGTADPARVGVFNSAATAPDSAATNAYGWICTLPVSIKISLASTCAANAPLYTTATSGVIDDESSSTILVQGVKNSTGSAITAAASTSCSSTVEMYVTV